MNINNEIYNLLKEIGPGRMSSTAYDTAWVARLGEIDSELSNRALEWICENQLPDGSWGAKDVFYYHDRVICTLAAMIALTYRGRRARDKAQIEKGLLALYRITLGATQGLALDPNGATVGFEMIVPTLVAEAEQLGIIKQQGDNILGRMSQLRERKMEKLGGLRISKYYTPAFSSEMAGDDGKRMLDVENLQEMNGSVANSPSATAYFAEKIRVGDEAALDYLHSTIQDRNGGAPFASPFNIFERAWILWNLSLVPGLLDNGEIHRQLVPHLNFLEQSWKPETGVGFSNEYTPSDGDDTGVTYDSLARLGRSLDINTILSYEDMDHFKCYPLEANPSIGANVHLLGALQRAGLEHNHPSILKIRKFLKKTCLPEGYWIDKWHISPYYMTAHAVIVCKDLEKDLCEKAINWILSTQQANGSWGSFGFSSAEETAYALQALNTWNKAEHKIAIQAGVRWLEQHYQPPYPALWISKALYCPEIVVESTILSALAMSKE